MSERQPLLHDEESSGGASAPPPDQSGPPSYDEINETTTAPDPKTIGQDEQPPPYSPAVVTSHINCRVCQAQISLEGRQHLHVIKCSNCNEATPIKNAPAGKKYVRCPCNCLLICSLDAVRIACPRENCQRMITLQTPAVRTGLQYNTSSAAAGGGVNVRARCGHCNQVFVFMRMNMKDKLAICPHCRQRSSVGSDFVRRRALLFGLIGVFFLAAGIITTAVSVDLGTGVGVYVVWVGAYVVGILNLIRSMMYCCVKISHPIE